jgi:DNA replicative helicase MCM subunit Mcm2 (Cdc46/Mcm family)
MAVDQPGLFGAVTARGEAYVIRLGLLYALLDLSDHIGPEHLRAALAVWQYCEDSARFIFEGVNANQQKVLDFLGEPKTKTQIIEGCFRRNRSAAEIDEDLEYLAQTGKIKRTRAENGVELFARNS